MRTCSICGKQVENGSTFCPYCGSYLNSVQEPTPSPAAPSKSEKSKTALLIVCVAVVVVLAAALLALLFLVPRNSEAQVEEVASSETEIDEEEALNVESLELFFVTGAENSVPLLSEAKANSTAICHLANGDTVNRMEIADGYWQVSLINSSATGYIDWHYLTANAAAVTEPQLYYVSDETDYLLLRSAPSFSDYEMVDKLEAGDCVTVLAKEQDGFWFVRSEAAYGYAEASCLLEEAEERIFGYGKEPESFLWIGTVHVQKGYLALRNAMAFDTSNELGKMYNGETVYVLDASEEYYYVYSPTLKQYGYTNGSYLLKGTTVQPEKPANERTVPYSYDYSDGEIYFVSVQTGYLALRSAKAYSSSNEIGKLYSGDMVELISASDSTYWYVYAPSLDLYGYVNQNYLY